MLTKNKIQSKNALFTVMTAFLLSYFLFNDLGIRYIFGYAVLGVILLILTIKSKFSVYFSSIKLLFLIMVSTTTIFSVLPNSNLGHLVISLTISMLMFTGYYLFMAPSEIAIKRFTYGLHALSLLFSFYLLFVKIFPNFYWRYIYIHLGDYSKQFAARFLPQGYGVTIGGSTTYASYLIFIALSFNIAYIMKTKCKKPLKAKIFTFVSSPIYFGAIMLANRRSEGLATIAVIFLMFVFSLKLRDKKDLGKKFLIAFIAVALALVIILSFAYFGFLSRYNDVLGFITQNTGSQPPELPDEELLPDVELPEGEITADEVTSGRSELWKTAFSLFLKNPIKGIGWEQFMNYNTYEHDVHNTYLQWLCESGIIGFVLLAVPMFAICFIIFAQTLRFAKNDKVSDTARLLNYVAIGMQAFYLLVNLIDPAYYHLNFFCFYTLSLVFAETANKLEFIDTGVEYDCLRRKFLPKLAKLKIFY